jgi:CheY-like chemotaxis protein
VKFTERGSVCVQVTARPMVDGRVSLDVRVSDTGIGISDSDMGKLFQEFSQADNSISRRFGGSGLGLTISQRLVSLMGGEITVSSVPGKGSAFAFSIALPPAAAPIAQQVTLPAAHDSHAARILLAEDNATNRLITGRMLERLGHTVTTVADGSAALAGVACGGYDLVLMDVMMPEMDGLAATRAIRALPGAAGAIPIIGLSGSVAAEDEAEARAAGMTGFAAKPITRATLRDVIAAAMEAHRAGNWAGSPSGDAGGAADRDGGGDPLIDHATLERLRAEVGAAALAEAVTEFLAYATTVASPAAWAEAVRPGTIRFTAHALAGAARNLALPRLAYAAGVVDRQARAGRPAPEGIALLAEVLSETLEALRAHPVGARGILAKQANPA